MAERMMLNIYVKDQAHAIVQRWLNRSDDSVSSRVVGLILADEKKKEKKGE